METTLGRPVLTFAGERLTVGDRVVVHAPSHPLHQRPGRVLFGGSTVVTVLVEGTPVGTNWPRAQLSKIEGA